MSEELFDIENRIVVVTGGLGQLGRQFSLALITHGAKVVVLDIRVEKKIIERYFSKYINSGNLLILQTDITKRSSLKKALLKINKLFGVPYGLINNAALDFPPDASGTGNAPFETYPESIWNKVLEVNLKGVFLCCQLIGGQMAQAGRGSIINISSIYGLVSPDQRIYEYRRNRGRDFFKPVAYSVSKSGLLNLTRYLATYWAKKGVRVNTLTLGGVFNKQDKEFLKNYCSRVPLGRMANEEEYKGAIIFLLSDASSYMTGSNLIIDGGWTAW